MLGTKVYNLCRFFFASFSLHSGQLGLRKERPLLQNGYSEKGLPTSDRSLSSDINFY